MHTVFRLWFYKDEYAQHYMLWVDILLSVLQASLPIALQFLPPIRKSTL